MIEPILRLLRSLTGTNDLLFHASLGSLIVLTVIGCGKVLKWLLAVAGRRIIAKTETDLDDEILAIVSSRVIALSSVTGVYFGIKELRQGLTGNHVLLLQFLEYADTALYLLTVVIVASVVIRVARTLTSHGIKAMTDRSRQEQMNLTLVPLANRIISIVIIALTAIIVLEHFGQSVTSLVTILAGFLALGLAAQDTISNMISGFIIMIDRPFRVGDRVKIPSGETGDVFEIGLRSTKILDFDNNVLIVPNNELVKTKIVNFGYPDTEVRVSVEVTVAYGTDVERMKRILLDIADAHPDVLKVPAPEAYLMKLGEYGLHFAMQCRVAEFKQQFLTAEAIRVSLYRELTRQRIEIPYPHHVVHNTYDTSAAIHDPGQGRTYAGKIIDLTVDRIQYPSGATGIREVVEHPGGAVIVCLFGNGDILLVRQYRRPFNGEVIELPAGKLDRGEDPLLCAQRELREETGFGAHHWEKLTALLATPGFCNEVLHVFLAREPFPMAEGQALEEGESTLRVTRVPIHEAIAMIERQEIVDGKTIAGILLAERKRTNL